MIYITYSNISVCILHTTLSGLDERGEQSAVLICLPAPRAFINPQDTCSVLWPLPPSHPYSYECRWGPKLHLSLELRYQQRNMKVEKKVTC